MEPQFRRQPLPPVINDTLGVLGRLAAESGVSLQALLDPSQGSAALAAVLGQARNPIRLHGRRAEEMFAYVVVALGRISALKREETTELVLSTEAEATVPDYRLVLRDGSELLVEVKNANEGTNSRSVKVAYLNRLAEYGRIFNRPVLMAFYWSRWRNWTMHKVEDLQRLAAGDRIRLSFAEALGRSEMHLLGDLMLGTEFPLSLRMIVTSRQLSRSGTSSQHLVRIESADLYVAGRRIANKRDQSIAWGVMMHGGWEESENVEFDGEQMKSIEFAFAPPEPAGDLGFAPVASLSSLASGRFTSLTTAGGEVRQLRPRALPAPPYPRADEDYRGVDLPLWKLVLQPRRE